MHVADVLRSVWQLCDADALAHGLEVGGEVAFHDASGTVVVATDHDMLHEVEPFGEGVHAGLGFGTGTVGRTDDIPVAAGMEREYVLLAFGDVEDLGRRVVDDGIETVDAVGRCWESLVVEHVLREYFLGYVAVLDVYYVAVDGGDVGEAWTGVFLSFLALACDRGSIAS